MMSDIKVTDKISGDDFEAEQKQKQIRKLRKLLREIEQLEEKAKVGALEKEQQEKVKKKECVLKELDDLEQKWYKKSILNYKYKSN